MSFISNLFWKYCSSFIFILEIAGNCILTQGITGILTLLQIINYKLIFLLSTIVIQNSELCREFCRTFDAQAFVLSL